MKRIFLIILILFSTSLIACSPKDDNISGNVVVKDNQPVIGSNDVEEMIIMKTFALIVQG